MTTYRPEPAGLDKLSITAKTLVTAAVGDHVLIADLSDSSNLKKVTVQTIVDLATNIPTAITVANEAVDTSCSILFATAATGNLEPKTNAGLTFNSATNALTATTFVGALTGNAATVTTNANLTGPVTSVGNATTIANGAISNGMLANGSVANLSGTNTGDQTNITGNASTVTTNANLTGHVTSVGNAAVLGSFTKAQLDAAVSDDNVAYVGQANTFVGNQAVTGNITASIATFPESNLSRIFGGSTGMSLEDYTGTSIRLYSNGKVKLNSASEVNNPTAATVALIVKGAASQTANLQEWQNSAATVVASVSPAGNITASGTGTLGIYTVATLPSASSNPYAEANVSDALTPAMGSTVASGGAVKTKVRSNGTNWTVAGI